jgi:hypothetical protein
MPNVCRDRDYRKWVRLLELWVPFATASRWAATLPVDKLYPPAKCLINMDTLLFFG